MARQFHLKRFEYDPFRDDLAKIHDRFEFPTELDMSPWLGSGPGPGLGLHAKAEEPHADVDVDAAGSCPGDRVAAKPDRGAYKLSAVVMHVGGPAAGHYYAYVRYREPPSAPPLPGSGKGDVMTTTMSTTKQKPTPTPTWVKLDDHRVTKVSEEEVLRDAFGGGGGVYTGPGADLQGLFGQVT